MDQRQQTNVAAVLYALAGYTIMRFVRKEDEPGRIETALLWAFWPVWGVFWTVADAQDHMTAVRRRRAVRRHMRMVGA